jgi:hypothetical protein
MGTVAKELDKVLLDLSGNNMIRTIELKTKIKFETILLRMNEYQKKRKLLKSGESMFTDYWNIKEPIDWEPLAKKILDIPNAGGKSEFSEALSVLYFMKYYNAYDIIYEKQVCYWIDYKMVDYICTIPSANNIRVGISVTRAMNYNRYRRGKDKRLYQEADYTIHDAYLLLEKKLSGLIIARNSIVEKHTFYLSILHIFCQSEYIANLLQYAYQSLDNYDYGLDVRGTVLLYLTVCTYPCIYTNYYPKV